MSNGTQESTDALAEIVIESFKLLQIHALLNPKRVKPHQGKIKLTTIMANPNVIIL